MQLNEVFVHGEGEVVIAYGKDIWLKPESFNLDLEEDAELIDVLVSLSDSDAEDFDGLDMSDLRNYILDYGLNALLLGTITDNDYLHISVDETRHSSASSTLAKVLKELNLRGVIASYNYIFANDEIEKEFEQSREEFLTPLKEKMFYHGTTLSNALSILIKGLRPNEKTNFQTINHDDKVFLTLNIEKAFFHAMHSSSKKDFPCILRMKVHDVSKLVLDYDLAMELYGSEHPLTISLGYNDVMAASGSARTYPDIGKSMPRDAIKQASDQSSLNTKLGVFGYVGRIPASHISGAYLDPESLKGYVLAQEYGTEDGSPDFFDADNMEWMTLSEMVGHINDFREELDEERDEE